VLQQQTVGKQIPGRVYPTVSAGQKQKTPPERGFLYKETKII
jgi:hypothetical protein